RAGPFRRALAYLIDFAIWMALLIVLIIAAMILSLGTGAGVGLAFVIYFVLQWGYSGVCEALFNGRTPGKAALGLRVVSDEGVPITGAQALLRNLLWAAEWALPFAFMPAIVSMLLSGKFQRLGDLAAGTMVIVESRPPRAGVLRVKDPAVEAILPWLPARVEAGPELARALADYIASRGRFGKARREEMALHVARPIRARYGLPSAASNDAIVCALYQRVFHGE
ncbi:MAG: RDD family protein, partial [Isosphaeraceae bacterium]|nr:RDD family protein [Isosphaeraceae bacterium]